MENLPFPLSSLPLRRDEDVVAELIRLKRELEEANRRVVALHAELDDKAAGVRRADDVQSRFLSNITHEWSPLSAILGLADLSRDERVRHGRAPQPELDYITQAAGQLWVLVNNVLDLIQGGRTVGRLARNSRRTAGRPGPTARSTHGERGRGRHEVGGPLQPGGLRERRRYNFER